MTTELSTPIVSDLSAAKLDAAVLLRENCELRLQMAQRDVDALARELAHDGFVLQRLGNGAWVYQPAPPERT